MALKGSYDRCLSYLGQFVPDGSDDGISSFWRKHLGARRNFPSFDEMLVMRRSGFTYGVGEVSPKEDVAAENAWAHETDAVVRASVEGIDFTRFPEPPTGAPHVFLHPDGRIASGSATINALTSHRIAELARGKNNLRVLEIGAGYGLGAFQLIHALPIEQYVICDLPHNLFLSSFFLQGSLPGRRGAYLGLDGDDEVGDAELLFLTPNQIDRLEGPFDLVINAYSLQEMDRSSVAAYFSLVERTLALDGRFYSLNAHGKAGIERPSDYPLGTLRIHSFAAPRRFPFHVFATEPYELVLARKGGNEPIPRHLDAIGGALQLGLGEELRSIFPAVADGDPHDVWLGALADAIWSRVVSEKEAALVRMEETERLPAATKYLAGTLAFVRGNEAVARSALEDAAAQLVPSHAQLRAFLMLACIAQAHGEAALRRDLVDRASSIAPHLASQVRALAQDPNYCAAAIAAQLCVVSRPTTSRRRAALSRVRRAVAHRAARLTP